jgi:heat shock protein HslJ
MTKKNAGLGLVLALALFAAGCGDDVLTGPSAVIGGVWKLQSLEIPGRGLVQIPQPANYTVEFKDGGQVAIKADCNSCSGTYTISGESMKISASACTTAFCGAASFDTAFLAVLNNANTFGVADSELTINSIQGIARLRR